MCRVVSRWNVSILTMMLKISGEFERLRGNEKQLANDFQELAILFSAMFQAWRKLVKKKRAFKSRREMEFKDINVSQHS